MFDVFGVYLIDFKQNIGGEISGKNYAVVMSKMSKKDDTLIVAPITSKKKGMKYRGGITIDCTKYQKNPTYEKAFIKIRKIREIHKSRFLGRKIYDLEESDVIKLKDTFRSYFDL